MSEPLPTESDAVRENRHALYRKIDKIEKHVGDMHLALVGNELGNIGLVKRVERIEAAVADTVTRTEIKDLIRKVEGHDRKLWLGMMVLSAAWAVIIAFKDKLFP